MANENDFGAIYCSTDFGEDTNIRESIPLDGAPDCFGSENLLFCSADIFNEWTPRGNAPVLNDATNPNLYNEPLVSSLPGNATRIDFQPDRNSRIISKTSVSLEAGQTYTLAAYARRNAGDSTAFRIGVSQVGGSDSSLGAVSTTSSGDRWSRVTHTFTAGATAEYIVVIYNAVAFVPQRLRLHLGWVSVHEGSEADIYRQSDCPESADPNFLLYQQWKDRTIAAGGNVSITFAEFEDLIDSSSNNADVMMITGAGRKETNLLDSSDMANATYWSPPAEIDITSLGAIAPEGLTAFRLQYNQAAGTRVIQAMNDTQPGGSVSKLSWLVRKGNNDNGRLYVYCFATSGNRAIHNLQWTWTGAVLTSVTNSSGTGSIVFSQVVDENGALTDWWHIDSYDIVPEGITSWNLQLTAVNDGSDPDGYQDYAGFTLTDVISQGFLERLTGSGSYSRGEGVFTLPIDGSADVRTFRNSEAWKRNYDSVAGHDRWAKVLRHEARFETSRINDVETQLGLRIDPQVTTLMVNSAMNDAASGSASGGGGLSGVPVTGTNTFVNSGTSINTTATADEYIQGATSYEIVAVAARLRFDQTLPSLDTGEKAVATLFGVFDGVMTLAEMIRASSSADLNLTWHVDGVVTGNGVAPSAGFHIVHLLFEATANGVVRDVRLGVGTSTIATGTLKIIHMMVTEGDHLPTSPIVTGAGESSKTVLKDDTDNTSVDGVYNTSQGWFYVHLRAPLGGWGTGNKWVFSLNAGTSSSNRLVIYVSNGNLRAQIVSEGSTIFTLRMDPVTGDQVKLLMQYEDEEQTLTVNGTQQDSLAAGWGGSFGATLDTMQLGTDRLGGSQINSHILAFEHGDNLMTQGQRESKTTL